MEKSRQSNIQKFKILFVNWKNFGSTGYGQHSKILVSNLQMNWEKLGPNWSFTVENKMTKLHKIESIFQTQWMRHSITLIFKNLWMNWEKICFLLGKMKLWTHHELEKFWIKVLTIWCITQTGDMSIMNTSTASFYSNQWFHEE